MVSGDDKVDSDDEDLNPDDVPVLEVQMASFSWFERVPSPSNPADAPSRGKVPNDLGVGIAPKERLLPESFDHSKKPSSPGG